LSPNARGRILGLTDDISGLEGNISFLGGNAKGIYGDCTKVQGDFDSCNLTPEERENGVDIQDLIKNTSELRKEKLIEKIEKVKKDLRSKIKIQKI
jgi:hypothetical protein